MTEFFDKVVEFVRTPEFLWVIILLQLVIIFWLIFARRGGEPRK